MKIQRTIRSTIVATALLGLLAGPVLARQPAVVEKNAASSIGPFIIGECDGFELEGSWDRVRTETERYDRDGNLLRVTVIVRYTGVIANASDPSRYVVDKGHRTLVDDYANELFYDLGGAHHVTLPGHGIVYAQAGRQVWDWISDDPLSVSGHADDPTVLCEHLD